MDDKSAYQKVLADLETERKAIDAAIALIKRKMGLSGGSPGSDEPDLGASELPRELRSDSFFGMNVPQAIKAYLAIVKKPTRASVIARELERGGLVHTSQNFAANVQTAMTRLKPDVVKVADGWGLAEWYKGRNIERLQRAKERSETEEPESET